MKSLEITKFSAIRLLIDYIDRFYQLLSCRAFVMLLRHVIIDGPFLHMTRDSLCKAHGGHPNVFLRTSLDRAYESVYHVASSNHVLLGGGVVSHDER